MYYILDASLKVVARASTERLAQEKIDILSGGYPMLFVVVEATRKEDIPYLNLYGFLSVMAPLLVFSNKNTTLE